MLATPAPDQPPAPTATTPAPPPPADGDGPLLGLLAGLAREAMRHEPADLVKFARGCVKRVCMERGGEDRGREGDPGPSLGRA